KRRFVVCSEANAVAVADVSEDRSRVLGFVPAGWYPTAARALSDGTLVVLNGRGVRSFPNPKGPSPVQKPEPVHLGIPAAEYVARIQTGTASLILPFSDAQLREYSRTVFANCPYRDARLDDQGTGNTGPVPNHPGLYTPLAA